ncbi:MAG: peptidylprolyl isomerase [Asticcacaulis sp.]|nr:peptidylprolyl isomerase [Asticcacaulis sp.]
MTGFRRWLVSSAAALLVAGAVQAADAPKPAPAPQDILDASGPAAWRNVAPEDMVVMQLADGATVVYELASAFAPVHVANIRQLVRSGYFDGAVILRVQDDYVVQWGRPDEDKTEAVGIEKHPPAEYEWPAAAKGFKSLPYRDAYAAKVGFVRSWPVAGDGKNQWLVHCYGMIGVARDVAPDTGDSTQLYTVIGHAPRHLDRNLAVVGRILSGMDRLAARPRGSEALGFYKDDAERTKIVSAKIAADLPEAEQPHWQVLDSGTPTFDAWVSARANRSGAFFVKAAGAVDLCNAMPPVRLRP